jgi:hypothetical protein
MTKEKQNCSKCEHSVYIGDCPKCNICIYDCSKYGNFFEEGKNYEDPCEYFKKQSPINLKK